MARYERRDRFYEAAREQGYRSRGAFKLIDLLRRVPQVRPGATVLELGCWPGGWLQVLAEKVGPEGRVVGVDTREVDPLDEQVSVLALDFTEPDALAAIRDATGGPADAILCDAAPQLTGIKDVDRAAVEELHEAAFAIAQELLSPKGALVIKGFPGQESDRFRKKLRKRFGQVTDVRPDGRRATSSEFYFTALPASASSSRTSSSSKRTRRRGRTHRETRG